MEESPEVIKNWLRNVQLLGRMSGRLAVQIEKMPDSILRGRPSSTASCELSVRGPCAANIYLLNELSVSIYSALLVTGVAISACEMYICKPVDKAYQRSLSLITFKGR